MPQTDLTPAYDPARLTPCERDLLRHELGVRFGQAPRVADGLFLRTWRTGERAGQVKVPKAMTGLIERGLVAVAPVPERGFPRAHFTPAGLDALRRLLRTDRRAFDPASYGHLYQELGVTPPKSRPG